MPPSNSQTVNSITPADEQHSSFPEIRIEVLHRELPLNLNGVLLESSDSKSVGKKDRHAPDMEFFIEFGFINQVNGYTRCPEITKANVMHSSFMSEAMWYNLIQGMKSQEL